MLGAYVKYGHCYGPPLFFFSFTQMHLFLEAAGQAGQLRFRRLRKKFVLGCFGGIGSQEARFLCTLAFLELRQHDALRERAGLAPLSPSDRSQFRARCFRQAPTRIFAALAKAIGMRLTGAPSLLACPSE